MNHELVSVMLPLALGNVKAGKNGCVQVNHFQGLLWDILKMYFYFYSRNTLHDYDKTLGYSLIYHETNLGRPFLTPF